MIESIVPSAWQGGYPNQYAMENGVELELMDISSDEQPPLVKTFQLNGSAYRFLKVHIEDSKWTDLFYDFASNTVTGIHECRYEYFEKFDTLATSTISCSGSGGSLGDDYYKYRFVMRDGKLYFYGACYSRFEKLGITIDFIAF